MPAAFADQTGEFVATDSPADGAFQAIFAALHASSVAVIGPVQPRFLVIPLLDSSGSVVGGLWGCTILTWMQLDMLFVPEDRRQRGTGSALVRAAEMEALARGCSDILVDAFSFQAAPFYEKLGFIRFGVLDDIPPGHQRIYYRKRLGVTR